MIFKTIIMMLLVFPFWQDASEMCFAQKKLGNLAKTFAIQGMKQLNAEEDSTNNKPKISAVPIVVGGLLGMVAGAGIGGWVDRPPKTPEGEPFELSKGIIIGWAVGAGIGSYLGYLLAKRDLNQQLARHQRRKRRPDNKLDNKKALQAVFYY